MQKRRLEDLRVLITGGSQGIGRATAVRFSQEGALVAIADIGSTALAEETLSILEPSAVGKHIAIAADVSNERDVSRSFEQVLNAFGGLDVLINIAATVTSAPSDDMTSEQFDRELAVNVRGVFLCSKAAIKHFKETGRHGVILNASSVHETIPKPGYLAYAVSKGALGNLTKTLALEFAPCGIRVNAVAPGATVTPFNRNWAENPERRREVEARIPLGRAAEAEEMAAVFAFLASRDASYITGQTIFVDGGLTLYADFQQNWSS